MRHALVHGTRQVVFCRGHLPRHTRMDVQHYGATNSLEDTNAFQH